MNDKLLEQADSLMRRRSYVAGAKARPAAPDDADDAGEANAAAAEISLEDVPVLTDVVGLSGFLEGSADAPAVAPEVLAAQIEAAVQDRLGELLLARQAELTQEIEAWLDEQMPQLVIRAMDGITDQLVALVASRAREELLPRLDASLRAPDAEADDSSGSD